MSHANIIVKFEVFTLVIGFMQDRGVKGSHNSGSINVYNYDITFVNTEDILCKIMANID